MFSIPILLGAMSMSHTLLIAGGVAAGAFGIFKSFGHIQSRRQESVRLAQIAAEEGMPHMSEMLSSYATGDYQGVLGALRGLYSELTDPHRRDAAMQLFLNKQLDKHLADGTKREALLTTIEKKLSIVIPRTPNTPVSSFASAPTP